MDRDRIASLLDTFEKSNLSVTLSNDQARELFRLALAHLDSTRARRVGEAVLAVLPYHRTEPQHELLEDLARLVEVGGYPGPMPGPARVYRAIAAALRGEP